VPLDFCTGCVLDRRQCCIAELIAVRFSIVCSFRPGFYLDMDYIGGKRRMKKVGMEVRKAVIPDDIRVCAAVSCHDVVEVGLI